MQVVGAGLGFSTTFQPLAVLVVVEMKRVAGLTTGGAGVKTTFQPWRPTVFIMVWRATVFIVLSGIERGKGFGSFVFACVECWMREKLICEQNSDRDGVGGVGNDVVVNESTFKARQGNTYNFFAPCDSSRALSWFLSVPTLSSEMPRPLIGPRLTKILDLVEGISVSIAPRRPGCGAGTTA